MPALSPPALRVETFPDLRVACVVHKGPYNQIGGAFERLFAWAEPAGVVGRGEAMVLAIYLDDPKSTPADRLTSLAAVTVPEGTQPAAGIELRTLRTEGAWALGRFEVAAQEFPKAWEIMHATVTARTDLALRHVPPMEIYRGDHMEHSEHKFTVDIAFAVERVD